MDITIIIDKSTFQSLNYSELYRLSCYYQHIITPVLTMEILGDLKKEVAEGKPASEDRVKDFANKLFPVETIINLHYKKLVIGDLLGNSITLDGRPIVGIEKSVESNGGQKGFLLNETVEEKSIYKWKEGNFSDADQIFSFLWRMTTTNEEVLKRLKENIKSELPNNIKNFHELNYVVDKYLSNPDNQQNFLFALIQNYEIDALAGVEIFNRWNIEGKPQLKKFAEYAYHCLKVDTLFLFGLASGLISNRPTNRVDLEYLYYQPFGNLFSSNDKVHKNLAPLLLRPYQKFILGTDLKQDFKLIVEYIENLELQERKFYKNKPPINETSLTFQLWREYFGYPERSNWNRNISETEKEMMRGKIKEFEKAIQGDNINLQSSDEAGFVYKKSYLAKKDPCFCGSGKKIIECCLTENEFDKLVLEQIQKNGKGDTTGNKLEIGEAVFLSDSPNIDERLE